MTPEQRRAGWRVAGETSAPGCIGSGQLVAFIDQAPASPFGASWDTCPECGRRVEIVRRDGSPVLAAHTPPEAAAPSRRDVPDGPTFGL